MLPHVMKREKRKPIMILRNVCPKYICCFLFQLFFIFLVFNIPKMLFNRTTSRTNVFFAVKVSLRNSKYTITISQFFPNPNIAPDTPSKTLKTGGVEYMKVHCLALCQTKSAIGTSKRLLFGMCFNRRYH